LKLRSSETPNSIPYQITGSVPKRGSILAIAAGIIASRKIAEYQIEPSGAGKAVRAVTVS
jgi:hypothetical protein